MLVNLGIVNTPLVSPMLDINFIIFSTKEKTIVTFCCFEIIVSSIDEELLEASYFE